MAKRVAAAYVHEGGTLYSLDRIEFVAFLKARAEGLREDAGDITRMGEPLKQKPTASWPTRIGAFRPCFEGGALSRADYLELWKAWTRGDGKVGGSPLPFNIGGPREV